MHIDALQHRGVLARQRVRSFVRLFASFDCSFVSLCVIKHVHGIFLYFIFFFHSLVRRMMRSHTWYGVCTQRQKQITFRAL